MGWWSYRRYNEPLAWGGGAIRRYHGSVPWGGGAKYIDTMGWLGGSRMKGGGL